MLWKKESTDKSALYVDYFADMGADLADLDAIIPKPNPLEWIKKSNALSEALRQEGNIQFVARNWTNAILAYNYAICFAENGSDALCQAYANRSACFFELDQFESCCTDIELALQCNECSDTLKQSIEQHQRDCADFMENIMSIENNIDEPKMDFESNENIACFANVLELDRKTELGYRITAKEDIDVDQRIFVEESIVSTLIGDQYLRCNVCLTRSNNLIPCTVCTTAMFCNSVCQNSIHHAVECGVTTAIEDDGKLLFLIRTVLHAISIFNGNVDDLMNFVENCIGKQSDFEPLTDVQLKYQQFLRIRPDRMIASGARRDPLIYLAYRALMVSKVGDWFVSIKLQRFLIHLIWQHNAIISLGSVHQYTDKYGQAKRLHLFPTFTQFNHSCTPNAMFHLTDNWAIITTMRLIKKGEEITVNYFGRNFSEDSTVERHEYVERLRDNFGIKCQCDVCENRTSAAAERKAMNDDSSYRKMKLKSLEQNNCRETAMDKKDMNGADDVNDMKYHVIEFLRKFGRSKWCEELNLATTILMEIHWKQIASRDLE